MMLLASSISGAFLAIVRRRALTRRLSSGPPNVLNVLVVSDTPMLCEHVLQAAQASSTLRGTELRLSRVAPTPGGVAPATPEGRALLSRAHVVLAAPSAFMPLLDAATTPALQWCQYTWAGVDAVVRGSSRRDYTATRVAGVFGPQMAEYVLGHVLCLEKGLGEAAAQQRARQWNSEPWKLAGSRRPLGALTLGVLGMGSIGAHIAHIATTVGMRVVGFKRSTAGTGPRAQTAPAAGEVRAATRGGGHEDGGHGHGTLETTSSLEEVLRRSDYVVNTLPSTSATRGLLDSGILARACGGNVASMESLVPPRRPPVLINVGRGDIVSESTLIDALSRGYLSHAVLDVFAVEPLPPSSTLWDHDKVTITPHVAAVSYAHDVAAVFISNLELWARGQPLQHVVNWQIGY